MSRRAYDPSARGLRKFVLLVIFAVTLPSLLLTSFGLIAIQNERHATVKRVRELYAPVTRKLSTRIQKRLNQLVSDSRVSLEHLSAWGKREVILSDDFLEVFKQDGKWIATNFFVLDTNEGLLVPRREPPDPSWHGFLPEAFEQALNLEFQANDAAGAAKIYTSLVNKLSSSSPLRCVCLNALGRSLARAGYHLKADEAFDQLVQHCEKFVDASGYNLALGAMLRRIQLSPLEDCGRFSELSLQLAFLLSNPELAASSAQVQLVVDQALEVLKKADCDTVGAAFQWLDSIAQRETMLSMFTGMVREIRDQAYLQVLRVGGARRVYLVKKVTDSQGGHGTISGCELIPSGLDSLLAKYLQEMEVEGVCAYLRPTEHEITEERQDLVAGMAFLDDTNLAWRLDLELGDIGALDRMANSRTRLYIWALVLLVLALVLGIGKTVQVMIRETRLSRLKTDFVSSVSHELRTPLTSIRMFTETLLLGRVKDKEEIKECLETIGQETERLSRLVERILDFSRMEAGRKAFQFHSQHLADLVQAAIAACRPVIEEGGFEVDTNLDEDLPPVWVDRDAMVEVVVNLLSNAIKYSTDDRKVEIWSRRKEDWIELSVSDHGIGIPRSEHKRIFEKFHRVETPLSSSVSGSGLGLSLVQYIVQAHQGEVQVVSSPGMGSKFIVRLPFPLTKEAENREDA